MKQITKHCNVMGHLNDGHYTLNLSDEEYELFEASTEEEQNEWLEDSGKFTMDDYDMYDTDFYGDCEVKTTEANNDIFINGLNSIKYDELIGGPLKACIEAQAVAAMRSWRFLQECGYGGDVQKYYDMLNFAKPFIEANKSPEIFDLLSQLNEELSDAITEINKKQQ